MLRKGVSSLLIPLKLRSAVQVDTGYVSKVIRATYIPGKKLRACVIQRLDPSLDHRSDDFWQRIKRNRIVGF